MSSIKCPGCGLVNFADAVSCKRCSSQFLEAAHDHHSSPTEASIQSPVQDPSESDGSFGPDIWRDGKLLVITEDTLLPDRCVRCNAPATKLLKRNLKWAPTYVGVVAMFSWILGAMLLINATETATIHVGLCQSHFNRRFFGMIVGGLLITLGLLMGFLTALNQDYWLLLYGGISLLIGAFVAVILTPTVSAQKIESPFIWLKGVHPSFLDSL